MIQTRNIENYAVKFFITRNDTSLLHSGTGFLLTFNNECYLASTRHNMFGENGTLIGPNLTIIQYDDFPNKLQLNYKISDLRLNSNIYENEKTDSLVIKLGAISPKTDQLSYLDGKSYKVNTFNLERDVAKFNSLGILDPLILSGYPFSLIEAQDSLNLRPIIRKGMISNLDSSNRIIYSDLLSTQGDSGSPVCIFDNDNVRVVGFLKNSLNKGGGLGFSLLMSVEHIEDLITQNV